MIVQVVNALGIVVVVDTVGIAEVVLGMGNDIPCGVAYNGPGLGSEDLVSIPVAGIVGVGFTFIPGPCHYYLDLYYCPICDLFYYLNLWHLFLYYPCHGCHSCFHPIVFYALVRNFLDLFLCFHCNLV